VHVKSRKRRIKEELPKKGGGPLPPPPLRSPSAPPPRHLRRVPRTTAMPPSRSSEAPLSMSPSCPNYFPFPLPADPSMEYPSPLLLSTYPFLPMQQPLQPQKKVQKRVEFSSRLAPSSSATTLLLYKLFLLSNIYRTTTTTTTTTAITTVTESI
jgi:hypothetical protein